MTASKDKGRRLENAVVDAFTSSGHQAERVPLSGALGGKYAGDVVVGTTEKPLLRIECKNREVLPEYLWTYLAQGDADAVVLKKNHKKPLVVLPLDAFIRMWGDLYEIKEEDK